MTCLLFPDGPARRSLLCLLRIAHKVSPWAGPPKTQGDRDDDKDWNQPPGWHRTRVEKGRDHQAKGNRGGPRPVVTDDEPVPEATERNNRRPDELHACLQGENPSACRRSSEMSVR